MKWSTGTRFNFSVAAGMREVVKLRVGSAGALGGLDVANAAFCLCLVDAQGVAVECAVEHGEEAGVLYVTLPAVTAGTYGYELSFTDDVGEVGLLLHGAVTALTRLHGDVLTEGAEAADVRELVVSESGLHGGPLGLRWAASSVAGRYAAEAKAAAGSAEDIKAAVEEFRVFAARWQEDISSVLVMNPVTGTIWVGGEDTGQPYRGEDGRAPRVNVYGFWEVYVDGLWVTLPYRAVGRDGLDGTEVRRVLLGGVEELPEGEERGVIYYVPTGGCAAATGWIRFDNAPVSDLGLYINGVHIYVDEDSAAISVWVEAINAADCGVVATGDASCATIYLTAAEAGTEGNLIGLEFKTALYGTGAGVANVSGETLSGETLTGGRDGYDMWCWLEGAGWVCFGGDPYGVATEASLGLVMLGTGLQVEGGAPVGLDELKRMAVPVASTTVPGVVMPSSADTGDVGGGIHITASGSLLADVASVTAFGSIKLSTSSVLTEGGIVGVNADGQLLVRRATPSALGAVMPGSFFAQLLESPYNQAVGVDGLGRLANCFVPGGALQHRRPDSWIDFKNGSMPWMDYDAFPDKDETNQAHYTGLVTTLQFGQDGERGLYLNAASTALLAGVYMAEGPEDVREAAVLSAAAVEGRYMPREEVFTKDEVEALLAECVKATGTWNGCEVLTEEAYNALGEAVEEKKFYVLI